MRNPLRKPPVGPTLAVAMLLASVDAQAQFEALEEGIGIGEWSFYPSLEMRVRGEYRRDPVDVGGDVYERTAVQNDAFESRLPPVTFRAPAVSDQWIVSERARLGLKVTYDVLTAKLSLQDSRVLGATPGSAVETGFGEFRPWEAYIDVRTDVDDPFFRARLGRQKIRWGDGRLLGDADWSPRPFSLDAALMHFSFYDFDIEAFGALLAIPGPVSVPHAPNGQTFEGTGAQLYGLQARWAILPLLQIELAGLARIARDPLPAQLTRGDTYTMDLRVSGEERGIEYAAEGAYQLGRVSGFGENYDINAFALAGRFAWQTALPWKLRFAAQGGYASGDDDPHAGDYKRFDPILPTVHEHHGMMDLYAWSNLIEGGGSVSAMPHEAVRYALGYTFVGLAEETGRWSTGYLLPVGADPNNDSLVLGHEVDVSVHVAPWDWASFSGGYGFMALGTGGKNIMVASGRKDTDLLHFGYLQAELRAP